MSPEEIQQAAELLQISIQKFIQTYASHTLGGGRQRVTRDEEDESVWIRLRDKDSNNPQKGAASCIFLDDENKCTIYEARPVQCRTYPFWPNVLQSVESWNDECRRKDGNDEDETNPLPPWTPEDGGCEGMQLVTLDNNKNEKNVNVAIYNETVPFREAYRQLFQYVTSDRRFPKGTERPVLPENSRQ